MGTLAPPGDDGVRRSSTIASSSSISSISPHAFWTEMLLFRDLFGVVMLELRR